MIRYGNAGLTVREVQLKLKAAGYSPGPIDGIFGEKTLAAVTKYQTDKRLQVDGIVGPQTYGSLFNDSFEIAETRNDALLESGSTTNKLLVEARKHLGFKEGAGNSNPFSTYFGRPPEAWCADFVSYVATKAGYKLNNPSAQRLLDEVKQKGTWKGRDNPQPGDIVGFAWDGKNGWADHVGLVERVYTQNGKLYVQTIEGNSSDSVRRKVYLADSPVIKGYGTLKE